MRNEFENINALVPQSASSDYGQRGYSIGGEDHYVFRSGAMLSSLFQWTDFDTDAHGQGRQPMLLTPNGVGGNYFNSYQRFGSQQEILESYRLPEKQWSGRHDFLVGGDWFHRAYNGTSISDPVLITNAKGSVLEREDFSGPARLSDQDSEFEAFAQDHWLMSDLLSVDYGLRFSGESIGKGSAFAPRLGIVYSPARTGSTVIRGGIGVFYDREALLAADFAENPIRTITLYSPAGIPLGIPQLWTNTYGGFGGTSISPTSHHLGVTPYDYTWSLEADHRLRPDWLLRASYLGSLSHDQFVVDPQALAGGRHAFALSDQGSPRYQELSSTVTWRPGEEAQINFAYVHSVARGDLNTLTQLYVPFEQPVIHSEAFATLPSDVPNRVITWGEFQVPWGLTLSPVFDIHNGFPYSSYNTLQQYAGQPDGYRFPLFYSLDLKISKQFHLPLIHTAFLRKHKFRGAIEIYDLTNHQNPVDVYNNTGSPFYGHFFGFRHMDFDTWFDVVY
jgi:hypothetical protein